MEAGNTEEKRKKLNSGELAKGRKRVRYRGKEGRKE